jgi:hypothetical protein
VFTVLVHKVWKDKDKVKHKGSIMLFLAKPFVADRLRKKARKLKGLKGATFDIARGEGKKTSSVGDDFDFVEKVSFKALKKEFPKLDIAPLDYEKVLPIYTEKQLLAMGFGDGIATAIGGEDDLL